jgi:Raf kinase inhibitor-like YbhB/YbcL family protein
VHALWVAAVALLVAGCSGEESESPETDPDIPLLPAGALEFTGGDVTMGAPIDQLHTCDGSNISPALEWVGGAEGAAELALIVDDPAAPGGTFTHWVVYAIPPDYTRLDRGIPPGPALSGDLTLRQGLTDGSDVPGWFGPCPPAGETHSYVFALYALDEQTGLEPGASVDDLRAAIEGHVIVEATLTAPYTRS